MKKIIILIVLFTTFIAQAQKDAVVISVGKSFTNNYPLISLNIGGHIDEKFDITTNIGKGSKEDFDNQINISTFEIGVQCDFYIADNFYIGAGLKYSVFDLKMKFPMETNQNIIEMTDCYVHYSGLAVPLKMGAKFNWFSIFIEYNILNLSSEGVHTYETYGGNNNALKLGNTSLQVPDVEGYYLKFGISFFIPM